MTVTLPLPGGRTASVGYSNRPPYMLRSIDVKSDENNDTENIVTSSIINNSNLSLAQKWRYIQYKERPACRKSIERFLAEHKGATLLDVAYGRTFIDGQSWTFTGSVPLQARKMIQELSSNTESKYRVKARHC
jgi:hypothetical protein